MKMPEYTIEQKAAAFDALWNGCGHAAGSLYRYVSKQAGAATFVRVPEYRFEIMFVGDTHTFADVLHHLATRGVT